MPTRLPAALALALFSSLASASPPGPSGWEGALAGGPAAFACADAEAGRREVSSAIERSISEMSFVLRPFARSRLEAGNRVFSRLVVRRDGGDLVVERDGAPVRSPADGSAAPWLSPGGETYQVRQSLDGPVLVQRFAADGVERINRLHLAADGATLRLEAVVRSDRLPAPVAYAVEYRRER
ncbi:MAG: hypothetical protein HZB56_21740 [Deltaproteobacteria bacterium]|nr:hypothetical protein [Deltaproteobacteria bacterium]